jgi:hypothetical protein
MLMNERLHRVRDRVHVALVEARLARSHSLRIAETSGFVPVGLLPLTMQMGGARKLLSAGAVLRRSAVAAAQSPSCHSRGVPAGPGGTGPLLASW